MGRTLDQVLDGLPREEREAVEARAEEILDEIETLQEIRKQLKVGQMDVAKGLGVSQPAVSKIEKKRAYTLSLAALDRYVTALGGHIDVRIIIPNHAPVRIERLQDLEEDPARDDSP